MQRFIDYLRKFYHSLWFEPVALFLMMFVFDLCGCAKLQGWSFLIGLAFGINGSTWSAKVDDKFAQKKNRQTKTQYSTIIIPKKGVKINDNFHVNNALLLSVLRILRRHQVCRLDG